MNVSTHSIRTLVAVAPCIALLAGSNLTAAPIAVDVNGSPVEFSGTLPTEVDGSVLVPLRGVFQAMGADVNYSSASRTITARKGDTFVELPLGSTTAVVNGQAQPLSEPARVVDGTTLVPLRFVAQALGGYVDWQASTNTVAITTSDEHLSQLPAPPGAGSVTGQVTGIFTNSTPKRMTMRVDGQDTSVPLADDVSVMRSISGSAATQVPLNSLQVGDQVTVDRDENGLAQNIGITYGQLKGTLKSIGQLPNGNNLVTLNDGTTVELAQDARIRMNGRHIALSDVMPNEDVLIRTSPRNHYGYELEVNPGNGPGPEPSPETATQALAPQVTSFDVSPNRPIHAGDILTATLVGTPGATATVDIPGVVQGLPMKETSPGNYTLTYPAPDNTTVQGATVLAQLTLDDVSSPTIQAPERVTIVTVGPKVTAFSPSLGTTVETGTPSIYATIADEGGVGIDPKHTVLTLDGHDVTGAATVTPTFIDLHPAAPLDAGEHSVHLTVADNAGNQTNQDWKFRVASSKVVQDFRTSTPDGAVLGSGDTMSFTLQAEPGGHAVVSIGGAARDIPLHETSSGRYVGTYTVPQGVNVTDAPVTAQFVSSDGRAVTTTLTSVVNIAAGIPESPDITLPTEGAPISGSMAIAGTAPPNSLVRVKVDYKGSVLGGILGLSGSAGTHDATADSHGHWTVNDMPLHTDNLFAGSNRVEYTITAVDINANGDESPPTSMVIKSGKVYAHHRGE